ncbi:uncharacterized protein LOC120212992 [Hibiscus syriacus]|uniref:uncharacterized protein LOC120212992 n=1 Tax=Hibiscus syriacus TaxID=106335 RepID=UPI001921749A|nr:uncharacterized protein LOC120212992 [Hibiscus syriacus]
MGACYKAQITHLLSSPNPHAKTLKPPLLNPATSTTTTTTRRFLLFSLSSSYSLACLGAGKLLQSGLMDALASSFDPVSQAEKDASAAVSRRVSEAVELLERGKELQAQGDFPKASSLLYFGG